MLVIVKNCNYHIKSFTMNTLNTLKDRFLGLKIL